jgi:hypothetical protein
MFTLPDASDAVATCPAFAPVGPIPDGFFADCNPGQNFPGTRPIADHFNELILNLRALLTQAGVTAVKGDPTMLWKSILRLGTITSNVTLNVDPSGVTEPANPFAGDKFDTLQHAIAYLARYRIAISATVTIQIAAGTFTSATTVYFYHADGVRVKIQGNSQSATILHFTTGQTGLVIYGTLGGLSNLTINSDGSGPVVNVEAPAALWVSSGAWCIAGNLTCTGFAADGVVVVGYLSVNATLTVTNNGAKGLLVAGGTVDATGQTIVMQNNVTNAIVVTSNGSLTADTVQTTGGAAPAVYIYSGGMLTARRVAIDVCGSPPNAVGMFVSNGAAAIALTTSVLGDWWTWSVTANQPQVFQAEFYGLIRAYAGMAANNKGNCSPAINTLGNTQAYIQA